MTNPNTGPLRKVWNKFKRGMSEINFILNISQTFVILWGSEAWRAVFSNFYVFLVLFFGGVVVSAVIVGGYALKNVDPTLSILNPFAQDMVRQRKAISLGLYHLTTALNEGSEDEVTSGLLDMVREGFGEAVDLTEKWIE